MRSISVLVLVALIAGFALVAHRGVDVSAVPAPGPGGFKWEYKVYTEVELANLTDAKTLEAALNKLGDDGWELVAIKAVNETPAMVAKNKLHALFVLKRLKQGK